jgi:hypothetical protein
MIRILSSSFLAKVYRIMKSKIIVEKTKIILEADNESQWSVESVDEDPIEIGSNLHILLKKQGVILIFDSKKNSGYGELKLKEVIHLKRIVPIIYLQARQVIEPFSIYCGVPLEEAIIHYTRDNALHFRIALQQCHRNWRIEGNILRVFSYEDSDESWKLSMTNQNNWSTY